MKHVAQCYFTNAKQRQVRYTMIHKEFIHEINKFVNFLCLDDSDECKVVNIAKNKTTFRSMACSNKEKILCFGE